MEWVCNEKKNRIANKLNMDLNYVHPNGGNVQEQNPMSMQFLKLSPQTRFKVLLQKEMSLP